MAVRPEQSKVTELISMLDKAVDAKDDDCRCLGVKDVLCEVVRSGEAFIGTDFLKPASACYARRLLHKDPAGRYTVLVMVWGSGQGTPLHDHAGKWCVECVYRGRIQVDSYALHGSDEDALVSFTKERTVFAGQGEAGALIPPFDYHTITNNEAAPAITIHVYGGELDWCHAFIPVEGGYRRERRELKYTE